MGQPEARLSRNIIKALRDRGAYVWKMHGGPMMPAGLPDIVGVYRGQFIGVETKMPGNTTSRIQDHVRSKLLKAGAHVIVAYSVSDALKVLDGECTPVTPLQAFTDELRASSEHLPARGPEHVARLLSGPRFID